MPEGDGRIDTDGPAGGEPTDDHGDSSRTNETTMTVTGSVGVMPKS
jgi:hypothetical protein